MDVEEIKRIAREKTIATALAGEPSPPVVESVTEPVEPAAPPADDGFIKLVEPPRQTRSKHQRQQKNDAPLTAPANIPPGVTHPDPGEVKVLSVRTLAEQEAGRAAVERRKQRDAEAVR